MTATTFLTTLARFAGTVRLPSAPRVVATLLGGLLLAGCASESKRVDRGTIRAGTFSFVQTTVPLSAEATDPESVMHRTIQGALVEELGKQGVTPVASGGDVTVAYLVILGDNVRTESIITYFGHGRSVDDLQGQAQRAYNRSKNPNSFEAGTLLVDVIDAKTFKLLHRNYVVRPTLRNRSADLRVAQIQEAVAELLQGVTFAR